MKKRLPQKLLKVKLLLLLLIALSHIGLTAQTNVTGNQSGTWTKANSPYIINGTVTVPAGLTLTIQAGVEVRSLKYDDILNVLGVLKAVGTAGDTIRFNGFANPSYNAASTHGGLMFFNSSSATDSSVMAYVVIDRMGDKDYWSSDQAAVEIAGGKVTIRNSAIRNSELRGIYGSNSLAANPIVSNVVFTNNAVSAYMYANNVGSFTNNVNFAVTLRGTYFTNAPVNFPKPGTGSYYIMEPGGSYDFSGCKVTIQPGVEFRSMSYDNKFSVSDSGVLVARGTITDSIKFVGYANPSYDTASTHGGLIYLNSSIVLDSSVLAYVAIDRMGDKSYWTSDQAALELGNGKVTIRNSSVRNSELRGIFGYNQLAYNPIVSGVVFTNNPVPAYMYANNVGSFSGNTNAVITLRATTFNNAAVNFPKPGTTSYYIMEPGATYSFTDAKVTIQPGAEFRSMAYDNQFAISGSGVLVARGTATDSIKFTGYANTAYSPMSSHGGLIYLNSSNTSDSSVIAYAAIDRMGDKDYWSSDQAALELGAGKVTIRNSSVRNSELRGIFGYSQLVYNPIVSSVVFNNNPVPAYLYANNVGSFSNNTNAIVTLRGTTFSGAPVTFPKAGTASYYIMEPGGTYGFTDAKVTIQPGAEFRSMAYDNQFAINGTGVLVAKGTATDSIKFTGYANTAYNALSTHGGLLYLNSTSTTDSSVFAYFVMEKMGDKDYWSSDQAAFEIGAGKIRMTNSSIRNSEYRGIYGYGDASGLTVRKSNIFGNKYGGDFSTGKPFFYKCNIFNNSLFGINNQSTNTPDTIDARTCWWGDATGPKQTSTNPLGKGNAVSLKVLYKPFLTYPYQNNDIGVDSILTPITNCGLTATEAIKVRLRNYGSATQTGFNIAYRINSGAVVTENVGTISIASDSAAYYTFTTKANLSVGGGSVYNIAVFTAAAVDTIRLNDTAKAAVVNNKPMLGKDSTVKVCPGGITSIRNLYSTTGYTSAVWSAANPDSVGAGSYSLIVTNSFGCKDTAVVSVANNVKPNLGKDTTVSICAGSVRSLKTVYTLTGLTATWSTTKPDSAGAGTYTLIVTNTTGCKDTAVITVTNYPKPNLGKDTTVSICLGSYTNIRRLYDTTGYVTKVWSAAKPDSATAGIYTLIVTNANGCKDTAKITVTNYAKPNLGKDSTVRVCPGFVTSIKTVYNLTGLTAVWSTPKPDSVGVGVYTLIVTNTSGCKDTAIITVASNVKPNLGKDTTVSICLGSSTSIRNLYSTTAYPTVVFSAAKPDSVVAGTYTLIVTNSTGCKDTAVITVTNYTKPNLGKDTTVRICPGSYTSIRNLYSTTAYTTAVFSTAKPDSVVAGTYTLIVTNSTGCKDTAIITVSNYTKPVLGKDTTVKICIGTTTSIRNLYNTTTYTTVVFSAAKPDSVGKGVYTLIVTNSTGCKDTAVITVDTLPTGVKPVITKTGNTAFCINDSLVLSSTATGNLQWLRNNNVIKYATTGKYVVTISGSYKLRVSTATTCAVVSDSVIATAVQVAKPAIALVNDTLVSSSATGNQWYFSGVAISGATGAKYAPVNIGYYTVQVTSGSCKSALSDPYMYTANTFAKTRKSSAMKVVVCPNPATDFARVIVSGNEKPVTITVSDLTGKILKTYSNIRVKTNAIDISEMNNGIYTVTVTDGKQQNVLKLVKGK